MRILAEYLMVDDATLDYLVDLDSDALASALEELSADPDAQKYCVERLWDGLHFLLTGKPADMPIDDDRLSEAVVGVHVFNDDDEDADFVGCTEDDELAGILDALKSVDMAELRASFEPEEFHKNKVYPNIWLTEGREALLSELIRELERLTAFYERGSAAGQHIVISLR